MTVEFAKYNRDRLPRFQIETVILREKGRRTVVKRALTPEAKAHIRELREGHRRLAEHIADPALRVPALLDGAEDRLAFEFVTGTSVDRLLFNAFFNRDPRAFWAVLDEYWRLLKTGFRTSAKLRVGTASAAVFGGLDLSTLEEAGPFFELSFLDAIFDNLIKADDGYVLIDNEWILEDALPVSFVLFRSVNELHHVRGAAFGLERFVPLDSIWSRYGLAPERVELYRRMEEAFQTSVFGAARPFQARNRCLKPAHQVPLLKMSVITELRGQVAKQRERIGEQQGRIVEQQERVLEQQGLIVKLQEEVRKRGEWGKSLDVIIHSLEKQVKEAAGVIERQNAELGRLHGVMGGQQTQLQYLRERNQRLDTIERSFSWKLISGMCCRVDDVLPPHSVRRFVSGRFLLGLFNLCRPWRWRQGFTRSGLRRFFLYTEGRQAFPVCAAPEVSVIIPAHNKWDYTQACLRAILAHSPGVSYEVIVADDASTDATRFHRRFFKNIRWVRNRKSLGFLANCNQAARAARGQLLFFLNNDTRVEEGAIRRLLERFRQDEKLGVAGSKLVYPDGRLQEAGGIIWRDASGWNYGRFQDPTRPEFNYVKEVDYVSGAAMMVRKTLWEQVGGFDARYTPAYFEDADLAFEARRRGFKVVYQPASCVVHDEGVSHGVDETTGIKKFQAINRDKFFAKWRGDLERDQYDNGRHVFHARERSRRRKTLLVIDHYAPKYDQDAGSRTTFQYLKLFLDAGLNVKFLGDNFHRDERYTPILEQMGIEVLYGVWYFQHWQSWIRENAADLDYVLFNRPHITVKYLDFIRAESRAKCLYYGHDLHHLRQRRKYELDRDPETLKDAAVWKAMEYDIFSKVDVVYYPSPVEVAECLRAFPNRVVRAIPAYIFDEFPEKRSVPFARTRDLLFVGGFGHPPNEDAVVWFVEQVFPEVRRRLPDVRFIVAGANPPEAVKRFQSDAVSILGHVPDDELDALYRQCRLAVVPLRYGAGVKGKVVEAMVRRLPVVTTSVGAEGLDGADSALCVAADAADFAARVAGLYADQPALERLAENGIAYVKSHFSRDQALQALSADIAFGPRM